MSKCVEKIPHSCGSRSGLQVFVKDDGTYDGYCFACGKAVADPYHDKPKGYKPVAIVKSKEEIEAELEEISHYQVLDLPARKLRKESLAHFGIKIGVSEADGATPVSHYYPYYRNGELIGYKVRLIEDKKMWAVGTTKQADFFGWEQAVAAGGKKLFITEGEIDAVSLFQIFKDHNKGTAYADLMPSVVSLTAGAGSATKELVRLLPEIRKTFKEIILCFDMDAPGKKAAEDVSKLIPDVLIASLPAKDINECLMQGRSKACYNAVQFNSQKLKNTRLVAGDDLHETAKEPPQFGVSWPWKSLTEVTRGIRKGETIYIGAG